VGDAPTDATGEAFDHRMMDIKYRERKRSEMRPFILTDNSLPSDLGDVQRQFAQHLRTHRDTAHADGDASKAKFEVVFPLPRNARAGTCTVSRYLMDIVRLRLMDIDAGSVFRHGVVLVARCEAPNTGVRTSLPSLGLPEIWRPTASHSHR
jgi:hypothetical protein